MRVQSLLIFLTFLLFVSGFEVLLDSEMFDRFVQKAERIAAVLGRPGHFLLIGRFLKQLERNGRDVSYIRMLMKDLYDANKGRGERSYEQILRQILLKLVIYGAKLKPQEE